MPAKVKRKTSPNKIPWYMYLVAATLLGGAVYVVLRPPTSSVLPTASPLNQLAPTTFRASSVMGGFTIEIPSGFQAEEKASLVSINSKNGSIKIGFVGTNYKTLTDHLSDPRNNIIKKLQNQEKLTINGLESINGFLSNEKNYFIYSNYAVYFIYTDSSQLYPDLDQIAQSFQIPEK